MINLRIILITLVLVSGCASSKQTMQVEQEIAVPLLAGIGDVLLHIEKKSCLKNAFGKCDIFKRKTNEGFIDVRFLGVEPNGEIVLSRKDVSIISNETTMSRTPVSFTSGRQNTAVTGNAQTSGSTTNYQGTAATSYQAVTLNPAKDFHVVVPSGEIAIRVPKTGAVIPIEGHVIEILAATPYSLEYSVKKQNK